MRSLSTLFRPGLTWRHGPLRLLGALGVGATVLTGADEESPFFLGSFKAGGSFWGFILRPEAGILYDAGPRVPLHVTPLAVDYSPAFGSSRTPTSSTWCASTSAPASKSGCRTSRVGNRHV